MFDYLKSCPNRAAGADVLEGEIREMDIAMHPDRDRDFIGLLLSFLQARRDYASIE